MYPEKRRLITDLDIVQENITHKQIELVKKVEEA